jgi:ribonuclease T2
MPLPRIARAVVRHRAAHALLLAACCALLPLASAAQSPWARTPRFDFYLLALTLEPAFCEDVEHARFGQCRRLRADAVARTPLVLHGLWPENLRPGTYPHDCSGAPLDLRPELRARLQRWMPGVQEGLDRHEWRTHGRCTGLDDDRYFDAAIRATERANAALGEVLRRNAGRRVAAATLRSAANAVDPGYGASVVLLCKNPRSPDPAKRRRPVLYEVRVCIDNDGADGAPGRLLQCPAVQRRDEGCGSEFWIDDV